MALRFPVALRNSRGQEIIDRAGANARLQLFDGTIATNADTAVGAQVMLAELTCGATLGTMSNGLLTFDAITQDSSANAQGTASWFRIVTSDGATVVTDGTVGTSGADLNLVTTSIAATQPVQITSFTILEGNA